MNSVWRRAQSIIGAVRNRIGPYEVVGAFVAAAILFSLFTSYKLIRADEMRGDSAMYLQGTENIATRGIPVSQVKSGIDYNTSRYEFTPVDAIAKDPLAIFGTPSAPREISIMHGHTYFVLYPIAVLVKIIPVRPVLIALYVASFIGMLLLAYLALRRRQVAFGGAALFCLLIATHPAWWEGLLWGQFYPDRLFVFAGFAFMLFASRDASPEKRAPNRVWLTLLAAVCASINERSAIVAGLFLFLYVLLYWRRPGLDRAYKLILGIALVLYGYAAVKWLVPGDAAYGSFLPTSLDGLIGAVQAPSFLSLFSLFLITNVPLLVLSAFEWRTAAIAVILMLPNVFGSIGGAEKTGWSTHYPAFYLAPLVFAALTGLAALWQKTPSRTWREATYALVAILLLFASSLGARSADTISVSPSNLRSSVLPTLYDEAQAYFSPGSGARVNEESWLSGIVNAVPPGSVVSSVEAGMPILYNGRTIEFFPQNIDHADYAVMGAWRADGKVLLGGAVDLSGPGESDKLTDLALKRMKQDGYDLEHPTLFLGYGGLAVIRRIH
jgi:hypothetical protein